MENSILSKKEEIQRWVGNLNDSDVIQQLLDIKYKNEEALPIFNSSDEKIHNVDFDQQFAAGMTSEELLENVFAHIETISRK